IKYDQNCEDRREGNLRGQGNMRVRNLFRLYVGPIIVLVLAVLVYFFLGFYIPSHLGSDLLFSRLADESQSVAPVIGLVLVVISFIWALYRSFLLWRA